jgi:excisionase family DNA binding protein
MNKPKQSAAPVERLLYSVDETCVALNLSRTVFYAQVKAGELETVRIGDRQYTTEKQRRDFIACKQRKSAA